MTKSVQDKRLELIRLVRCEPCIKTCLARLTQAVMYKPAEITERGQSLNSKLVMHINRHLNEFIHSAIEMAHLCGFVAFYIKKIESIPTFITLPLGTFSWYVELNSKPSDAEVLSYRVNYFGGGISEKDIHIFNFVQPTFDPTGSILSPMETIYDNYCLKMVQMNTVLQSEKWNMSKHLAVTEKIDLKDPTTSGLALLDDLRLYNLTGQHSNMDAHRLLNYHSSHNHTQNAAQGTFQWINNVFTNENKERSAQVHILPPNTAIQELSSMEYSSLYEYLATQFENSVYLFFDLAPILSNQQNNANLDTQTNRHQQNKIEAMSSFCERLIVRAYSVAFNVNESEVTCQLKPMPRLQINGIDEFKSLSEAGIMNPQDKMKIRSMFMEK